MALRAGRRVAARRDAAGRLGVPEGTLSSRLSRARSLLRDRLARRGVSLGEGHFAAVAADRAAAMPSDLLIDSTVRLSLCYAARGAAAGIVPAAVSSLAEGVIGMISAAKFKLVVASGFALVATASLLGGIALAIGSRPVARVTKPPAVVVVAEPIAGPLMLRGVVVDEAGKPIRGRVIRADGSPAAGIRVRAYGSGQGFDDGSGQARTAADGTYEMSVSPEEAYAVYVDDKDWTATTRLDVVIREGKPASGIDFRLTRGSILRGTVTVGTGDKPSPGESVWLSEVGKEAPKELREPGDRTWRPARRQLNTMTDAQGRYSFRLGPGSYTLMGPARTKNEKITVQDEPELVRDFHMPRADKGPLSGRVVVAGRKGEGVAEASVEIVAGVSAGSYPVRIRADAEGRFRVDRTLDHCYVCAKSPDGSLGALVEIGAEDAEVVIEVAPTATARGILLDEAGQAVVNREVDWGRRINFDDSRGSSTEAFATKVKTDALGRFTLPSLVIGQEYDISLKRDGAYYAAGVVRPAKAEAIDLGPLRAGSYRPPAPADAEEESSFRPDAPGAGVEAPAIAATTLDGQPLRLAVFCGKYVLLDFWATWCGPCIGEIPQLQAVHDAFGKDGRFAILSLSVDEKVDEPRAFQVKRKLPWAQGFVGGSVHGEVPGRYGVRAIPAFVLVGPDGRIIARGMRGGEILREVEKALGKKP